MLMSSLSHFNLKELQQNWVWNEFNYFGYYLEVQTAHNFVHVVDSGPCKKSHRSKDAKTLLLMARFGKAAT